MFLALQIQTYQGQGIKTKNTEHGSRLTHVHGVMCVLVHSPFDWVHHLHANPHNNGWPPTPWSMDINTLMKWKSSQWNRNAPLINCCLLTELRSGVHSWLSPVCLKVEITDRLFNAVLFSTLASLTPVLIASAWNCEEYETDPQIPFQTGIFVSWWV